MNLFDPQCVDASVIDRYLSRLAENTVQLASWSKTCEQRNSLLQEELEQLKSSVIQIGRKIEDHEDKISEIRNQIKFSKNNSNSFQIGFIKDGSRNVSIEGLPNHYLTWRFNLGEYVRKNQVIAYCDPFKDSSIERKCIQSPVDGIVIERFFPDGRFLSGY